MDVDVWQEFVDICLRGLFTLKNQLTDLPAVPVGDGIEKMSREGWENYYTKFHESMERMHDTTSEILTHTLPFHYQRKEAILATWSGDERRTSTLLSGKDFTVMVHGEHTPLGETLAIFTKLAKTLLTNMERYFLLSHTNVPNWKIISSIIDSCEPSLVRTSKNNPIDDSDDTPLEVSFFMELCKVRTIWACMKLLEENFSNPLITGGDKAAKVLASQNVLPGNFRYIKLNNGRPLVEILSKTSLDYCILFMPQNQVEASFSSIFLQLNLIPYSTVIENYLQSLLNRMVWFFTCPQEGSDLNLPGYFTEIDLSSGSGALNDMFYWLKNVDRSVNVENVEQYVLSMDEALSLLNISTSAEKVTVRTPNVDYTYRSILRYIVILRKLFARNYMKFTEVNRHTSIPTDVKTVSILLQTVINNKFKVVNQRIKGNAHKKHQELLYPPSDKEWVKYKHRLEYINDASIIDILYPELKNQLSSLVSKDIVKIFLHPQVTEAALFESMVLQILKLLMGDKFHFETHFVCTEKNLPNLFVEVYVENREKVRLPLMVQSFNRFSLYYENSLHEYVSIFDCIAHLFTILVTDFSDHVQTHFCAYFIEDLKKANRLMEKQKAQDEGTVVRGGIMLEKSAHKSLEYMEEVKEQESKTFLNCELADL